MIFRKILVCSLLFAVTLAAPANKVELKLTASLKTTNVVNIFVKFHGDTSDAIRRAQNLLSTASRGDKITQIVSDLQSLSKSSQQNAINFLRVRSPFTFHKQIWISNELYIKGASSQLVQQLALLPEVKEIREERVLSLEPLANINNIASNEIEWNVQKVEADQAWNLFGGNNGSGVVVANIDSGVRRTHETLRDNQRANYNWFDPYDHTETAHDFGQAHGTHTMGTLAGTKGIGVAPGAQWIACKGWDLFGGTESGLKECGQWILCPTLPNGQSPNCSLSPRVVSNSWGGRHHEDFFYDEVIEAWRAADIIPVFANGNYGPGCSTAITPAIHPDVISVGATTQSDSIADFSSAGPTSEGVIKPDISAPGHLIRSAVTIGGDTGYETYSGTSMATPHVAGAVALLLSRDPELTYDQVKEILIKYADTDTLADAESTCGGIPSTQFPNNHYGHGRLNARRALASLISGNP